MATSTSLWLPVSRAASGRRWVSGAASSEPSGALAAESLTGCGAGVVWRQCPARVTCPRLQLAAAAPIVRNGAPDTADQAGSTATCRAAAAAGPALQHRWRGINQPCGIERQQFADAMTERLGSPNRGWAAAVLSLFRGSHSPPSAVRPTSRHPAAFNRRQALPAGQRNAAPTSPVLAPTWQEDDAMAERCTLRVTSANCTPRGSELVILVPTVFPALLLCERLQNPPAPAACA